LRLRTRVIVGFAALSLLAAACDGYGNDDTQGGVDDGGVGQTGSTGATGPSAAGSTGTSEATAATGETSIAAVRVSVNNYLFDPDPVEVTTGDVVEVRNDNAKTPHTFTVVGEGVDLELGPQEVETVTISLEPGTYELICRFHESLPMTGTLVVT
jgi:plastocyanin